MRHTRILSVQLSPHPPAPKVRSLLRHLLTAVVATTLAVALAACSDAGTATSGVRVADAEEVAELLEEEPERVVIDVRTPAEYAEGHLEGAVLVDFNAPDFAEQIAEFDTDGEYVIYCRSGNRSAGARDVMTDLGFEDVVDVEGGIVAWNDAGLPTVTG